MNLEVTIDSPIPSRQHAAYVHRAYSLAIGSALVCAIGSVITLICVLRQSSHLEVQKNSAQPLQRPSTIFTKSLGELATNLSSRTKYIQTVVRLDIDQRTLRDLIRRDELLAKKFTSFSRGRLTARWSAGYTKRKADRLVIDAFVDRYVPRLKDTALGVLAAHSPSDLKDDQWMLKLRDELMEGFNLAMKLPKPIIVNVGVSSFRVVGLERLRPNASFSES